MFFRQERVGLNGDPFRIFKFRTMVANAEELLPGLLSRNEGRGLLFKLKDDPRITPLGRFLRRYSLDEIPQFINVLIGDMSIVGPRPLLERYTAYFTEREMVRLEVRPGITGWAQINGRDELPISEKVTLDVEYLHRKTLWFDIRILWLTFVKVIRRDGITH